MELLDRARIGCQVIFDSRSAPGLEPEWEVAYTLYTDGHCYPFPILLFWLCLGGPSTWHSVRVDHATDEMIALICHTMWDRVVFNSLMWESDLDQAYENFDQSI